MNFICLADKPEAIPTIAQWFFDAWGERVQGSSMATIARELTDALNRDKAPLFLLAVEQDIVLGVAGLKIREMTDYPQFEYWLGGVYVPEPYRGRQLASQLADGIAVQAASLGIGQLYLQTDNLRGGLYAKLGWETVETVQAHGHDVLIMVRRLAPLSVELANTLVNLEACHNSVIKN